MCTFAFTNVMIIFFFFKKKYNFTLIFLTVLLVLIQALSLSACNNVNLFITEMEQGKHL